MPGKKKGEETRSKTGRDSRVSRRLRRYWLSFDLGLRGPYEELYTWLDKMGASECVGNLATFHSDKSRETLVKELQMLFLDQPQRRVRLYLISMTEGGKFVLGKRKAPQWSGYDIEAPSQEDEV